MADIQVGDRVELATQNPELNLGKGTLIGVNNRTAHVIFDADPTSVFTDRLSNLRKVNVRTATVNDEIGEMERAKVRLQNSIDGADLTDEQQASIETRLDELDREIERANAKEATMNPLFFTTGLRGATALMASEIEDGNINTLRSPSTKEVADNADEEIAVRPKGEPGEGADYTPRLSSKRIAGDLQPGDSVEMVSNSSVYPLEPWAKSFNPGARGVVKDVYVDGINVDVEGVGTIQTTLDNVRKTAGEFDRPATMVIKGTREEAEAAIAQHGIKAHWVGVVSLSDAQVFHVDGEPDASTLNQWFTEDLGHNPPFPGGTLLSWSQDQYGTEQDSMDPPPTRGASSRRTAYEAHYTDGQEAMVGDTIQAGSYEAVVREIYDTNTLNCEFPGGPAVAYSSDPFVKLIRRSETFDEVNKRGAAKPSHRTAGEPPATLSSEVVCNIVSDLSQEAGDPQNGDFILQEPWASKFIERVKSEVGQIHPEDEAVLEWNNYHSPLELLRNNGLVSGEKYASVHTAELQVGDEVEITYEPEKGQTGVIDRIEGDKYYLKEKVGIDTPGGAWFYASDLEKIGSSRQASRRTAKFEVGYKVKYRPETMNPDSPYQGIIGTVTQEAQSGWYGPVVHWDGNVPYNDQIVEFNMITQASVRHADGVPPTMGGAPEGMEETAEPVIALDADLFSTTKEENKDKEDDGIDTRDNNRDGGSILDSAAGGGSGSQSNGPFVGPPSASPGQALGSRRGRRIAAMDAHGEELNVGDTISIGGSGITRMIESFSTDAAGLTYVVFDRPLGDGLDRTTPQDVVKMGGESTPGFDVPEETGETPVSAAIRVYRRSAKSVDEYENSWTANDANGQPLAVGDTVTSAHPADADETSTMEYEIVGYSNTQLKVKGPDGDISYVPPSGSVKVGSKRVGSRAREGSMKTAGYFVWLSKVPVVRGQIVGTTDNIYDRGDRILVTDVDPSDGLGFNGIILPTSENGALGEVLSEPEISRIENESSEAD